ncbi:MAG: bifunctional UDP-N-acetylglucosamine diphosphorylase/glucosamine-1-phosphate N-acetyltransferase GlmU [Thermotoga sp.]|nr:MAG: bifunctional UDP-N-acetylglucosamine diphosphorylase/glucosamine-1-phosphate N-acetyltransferase GlmU [Thermotoga sp.]
MFKVLILAGGIGKRMKSKIPKIFHNIIDKPMIEYVVKLAFGLNPDEVAIVLGKWYDEKRYGEYFKSKNMSIFMQSEPLGTGHAISCAMDFLEGEGDILILYGDVPLLRFDTIERMRRAHLEEKNDMTILTAIVEDPAGYGRVVRRDGRVRMIVEDADANEEQKSIREINSGIYMFKIPVLRKNLKYLRNENKQGEYYLTDLVEILDERKYKIGTVMVEDPDEITGVNTRKQLVDVERKMRYRIMDELMENGVTIEDPDTTFIGSEVKIGMDTIVKPMTFIFGDTEIGEDCVIGPNVFLEDSKLGKGVRMSFSHCQCVTIEDEVTIGPFSRLRPGTHIKKNVKIGNFVEVKNSIISENSRASHLSYIGDAFVGKNVNIGAGTITCNYDGFKKNRTEIEDGAFIGSNSSLVAPVKIGKDSIIGAGSVITEDVPPDSLGIGRGRQVNKIGWAKSWREKKRAERSVEGE